MEMQKQQKQVVNSGHRLQWASPTIMFANLLLVGLCLPFFFPLSFFVGVTLLRCTTLSVPALCCKKRLLYFGPQIIFAIKTLSL